MLRSFMTKLLATAALALSLVVPSAGVTHAQTDVGVPGGPFATAFRIQNLGNANANCQYILYSASGAQAFNSANSAATALPTIAPDESAYVYTPNIAGIPGGQTLAGVVSCDQPVAAVVNYSDLAGQSGASGDTYVGTSAPASTLFVPSIYNNYFSYFTSLRIMDASGAANTGKVEYFQGSTRVGEDPLNLAANGSVTISQNGKQFLNNDTVYSARITGSGPLAAITQIYGGVGTPVQDQLYAFSAFSGGATKVYAPVVMSNYFGYNTAITVQNAGSATASVRVTYSNGTLRNFDLAAGASNTLLDFQILPASNSLYSAVIENTGATPQPLIVTVNESKGTGKYATTYEGQATGGKTLVAPIVMKTYFGYSSSITCQNVGSGTATVQVAYKGNVMGSDDKPVSPVNVAAATKLTLEANKTGDVLQFLESSLPNSFLGSATITSNLDVVCVVNQSIVGGYPAGQVEPLDQDQLYAYNAIIK